MPEQQPITVYFTGDKDGPDHFGIVYDTEDEAMEVARENSEQAWRVSVIPDWDNAVHLPFEDEEEDDDAEEAYDFPFEELDARFTKLPNPSDPSEADHWSYEDAVKMPLNQVWTVVEGDSGRDWWATTGFHIVNKLFYVVTQEPWTDEDSAKNFKY